MGLSGLRFLVFSAKKINQLFQRRTRA